MEVQWSQMMNQGRQKYQIINIVAKRARQLNEGIRPAGPGGEALDPISTAIAELKADKLRVTAIEPDADEEEEEEED